VKLDVESRTKRLDEGSVLGRLSAANSVVEVYRANVQIPLVAQLDEEMKKRNGVCAATYASKNAIPRAKRDSGTGRFREKLRKFIGVRVE
jgi:hypothetical protein